MFPEERRAWLTLQARSTGRLDVNDCAEVLGVTVETIRRDLNQLESKNLLRRVHGGAIPNEGLGFELTLPSRNLQFKDDKKRIALAAVELVKDADSVFLDEGSSVQTFCEIWSPEKPVTVATAAIGNALALANNPNVSIILLGGKLRTHTLATADIWGTRMLADLVIDVALIGTNGISINNGATCPAQPVAAVKTAGISASHSSYLLAHSSKFGFDSFFKFARLNDFKGIITDVALGDEVFKKFIKSGMVVQRV